jgi:tripartite-type tricarboxylate transporter receptor subunit TctC
VPSINETFPSYRDAPSWIGIVGPAGMTRSLVERLNGAIVKTMNLPEVHAAYDKLGLRVIASSPGELGAAMRSGSEQVARLVKQANIQPE